MISHIEVRNFQSLQHVDLDLLPFTVIVGASSSGKSAFTRALRTLTSYRRGNAFISHGERVSTISAKTDRGTVTLKRGKGTADNEYLILPEDKPEQQRSFTKLGGDVPPEVSDFLGIPAKDPINYAGQFDKPYLLDDSPAEVARTIGALTNVHIVFGGARESNRRKLAAAATLRTRTEDLASIRERAKDFTGLKAKRTAMDNAEVALSAATELTKRIERLSAALAALTTAATTARACKKILDQPTPDLTAAFAARDRRAIFDAHWDTLVMQIAAAREAKAATEEHSNALIEKQQAYISALQQNGTCPTCGQATHEGAAVIHV